MKNNDNLSVLYIDPWFANGSNLFYYSSGLAESIGKNCLLTVVSAKKCDTPSDASYKMKKVFFPFSDRMKKSFFRKIVRGFEYFFAYKKIIKLLKKNHYDVVHIEWLLFYKYDLKILSRIKRLTGLLVLKAHNVVPHVNGEKYIGILKRIYYVPDIILLHGDKLVEQFRNIFPESSDKCRIQRHGIYLNHNTSFDRNHITNSLPEKICSFKRVYLFFGRIGHGKGVDRLIRIWKNEKQLVNSILVIAGKLGEDIDEKVFLDSLKGINNIVFINQFIEENMLNYLIHTSNLVLLPYREGSMSGVFFTAANFAKPILTTNFGSIEDYISNNDCAFVCENDDNSLKETILKIDKDFSNEQLEKIGLFFQKYVEKSFCWESIGYDLVNDVYIKQLIIKNKNEL